MEDNEPHLRSQLKAGERVLTKAIRERNNLQDANIRLSVELKDVRAQLADSVKENRRLRCGIYSKCLTELLTEYSLASTVRQGSVLTELCLQVC